MPNEMIFLNFDNIKKGGNVKMNQEIGTVKIRFKGIDRALELVYPGLKTKVQFDERGVAEVPASIAKKLLGPDFAGAGYELYKEEEVLKTERKAKIQEKPESKTKEAEFLAEINK
jgi:hypothetical protein